MSGYKYGQRKERFALISSLHYYSYLTPLLMETFFLYEDFSIWVVLFFSTETNQF